MAHFFCMVHAHCSDPGNGVTIQSRIWHTFKVVIKLTWLIWAGDPTNLLKTQHQTNRENSVIVGTWVKFISNICRNSPVEPTTIFKILNIWKTRLDCGVGVKVNMIPKGWDASAPSVQLRVFWEKYGFDDDMRLVKLRSDSYNDTFFSYYQWFRKMNNYEKLYCDL